MIKEDFLVLIDKASTLLYQNFEEDGLRAYVEIIKCIQNAAENGLDKYLTEDSILHIKASSEAYSHSDMIGLSDEIVLIGAFLNG